MSRLLLVSNRLPLTFHSTADGMQLTRSTGGLATGLRGPHERSHGLWIGWPGDVSRLAPDQTNELVERLRAEHVVPVFLTRAEVEGFYEGFSNRVLWPLFHYLLDHIPLEAMQWEHYQRVNARFADAVARVWRDGDMIWVQDYHLFLLPGMLRERLPNARIGFFLHIPFPSVEVLQALPWRDELLRGLLGADLIGFHEFSYARHFSIALLRLLGLTSEVGSVRVGGRVVRFGAYPMGIDAKTFDADARLPETEEKVARLRAQSEGQAILLSVDRLDYTKGIRRRLVAVDRLLTRKPELCGKLKLIQIAVPSRTGIDEYAEFASDVEEVVGHVNGRHANTGWVPVHYLYRGFSQKDLAAFYRAADVMLVTPLRDGMNLVAKEFCASRSDERGVLVLSEFAGAAAELGEALLVNPYDVDRVGERIEQALAMGVREQAVRMRALRRRVFSYDVHRWVENFLEDLEHASRRVEPKPAVSEPRQLSEARAKVLAAPSVEFLLDCDGTLLEFAELPDLVRPDAELLALLRELAALRGAAVHMVSGRSRDTLDDWFAGLDVALHAEHGLWSKEAPDQPWMTPREDRHEWKDSVRRILEAYAERTPGSLVEEKTASLAWHYRRVDPEFGALQAKELSLVLREALSNVPVEVLNGEKVIEVRPHGANKGLVVPKALAKAPRGSLVVALGDDLTDEDLFRALPQGSVAIHVGPRPSVAALRVASVRDARAFLREIIDARREAVIAPAP